MNRNILANLAGKFWSLLSNFIFIPVYIHLLGVDSYSVIALSVLLSGIMVVLDAGLSVAISREMARGDVGQDDKFKAFRSLETIYLLIAIACVVAGVVLAGPIARTFVDDSPVDEATLVLCLRMIVAEAGLQMFFRFYVSTFMGLEKQVTANLFNIGWGVLRNGVVIAILFADRSLPAFFAWQLLSSLVCLATAKGTLERTLRPWRPAVVPIDRQVLQRIGAFTAGVFFISLVAVVNTQLDRVMVSYLLELEQLGFYTLAVSVGTGMLMVSSPFVAAIQPRLTAWFSEGRTAEAADLYLRVTTQVAILLFPAAAVIGLNAEVTMRAWIGDALVAEQSSPVVPWIVTAYAMLSLSSMTYGIALANGFTRYNNVIGGVTLFVSIPGYWLAVSNFGSAGAAMLFLAIQASGSLVFHVLIERRFLRNGAVRTFLQLWLVPAGSAVILAGLMRTAIDVGAASRPMLFVYLASAYLVVLAGTAAVTSSLFRIRWGFGEDVHARHA